MKYLYKKINTFIVIPIVLLLFTAAMPIKVSSPPAAAEMKIANNYFLYVMDC